MDRAPLGVAMVDATGRITAANRCLRDWFTLFAEPCGAATPRAFRCEACGEHCSRLCRELRAHVAGGSREPFVRREMAAGGLILEMRFERLPDSDEGLLVVENVSQRHASDRLLDILRRLLELTPDMVGVAGRDLSFLWTNPAMGRVVDVLQPVMAGRQIESLFVDDAATPVTIARTPIRRPGAGEPEAWVSQVLMAYRDEVTGEQFYATICRDITARVQDEQALRVANTRLEELLSARSQELSYNREFLRSLIETNRDLILSVDAGGIVTFANAGFVGPGSSALVGTPLQDLVETGQRAGFAACVAEVLAGRQDHAQFEATGAGTLSQRWCLFSLGQVRVGARVTGITVVVSDLTALNEAWERLRANEKLVATARMAARIAHEINNPLTGISGAIQLIKSDLAEDSPTWRYAGMIEREIARVSNIVRQMYGLYRPEQEMSRTIDLRPLVEEVVTLMRVDAGQKSLNLVSSIAGPEPASVQEQNLRQVLMNVLRNAIEVSPPGGEVDVTVQRCGRCVDVVVSDRGPGITEELRQRMFEPFFTTKSTSGGRGLGLGLSISDALVKAMGGSISFTNREGGGAACTICLPHAGVAPAA